MYNLSRFDIKLVANSVVPEDQIGVLLRSDAYRQFKDALSEATDKFEAACPEGVAVDFEIAE